LAAGIVDGPEISINKRAFNRLVAQFLARAPAVEIRLGHPESITPEGPDRLRFPEPHQAFPHRRVTRKTRTGRRRESIRRLDVKRQQRSIRLARNGRRVKAVTRDRISARSVIY